MEAINKWAYALGEEIGDEKSYNGIFFDSKEDALDEAVYVARMVDIPTVWVGQVEMYQPVISIAEELIYQLQDQAYEEFGEYSTGWLDDVTEDDENELNGVIEKCFFEWLEAHPEYRPDFFTITGSKAYEVGEGK